MNKVLHILNGDGTARNFVHAEIPGEFLVWREMMMEGPVSASDPADEFWSARAAFIANEYAHSPAEYEQTFLPEWQKLRRVPDYDEVVLWFEYDLFCQANLLFLLNWFFQNFPDSRLSLISPATHPEVDPFYGMGQLSPAQLAALFPDRQVLSGNTLEMGSMVWQAWCEGPLELEEISKGLPEKNLPLTHLPAALHAHFTRFPAVSDGMNCVERCIVMALSRESLSPAALFRQFHLQFPELGMGDLQFFAELKALTPHWVTQIEEDFHLTTPGQRLAHGVANRLDHGFPCKWLGGYRMEPDGEMILWDLERQSLVRRNPGS